jgi:hypothetical protein
MAPRFDPIQPLAPAISGAYGAAEAALRSNPVIQRQMEAGTQAQLQAAQNAQRMRQQGASQNLALAQRQTEADYANAQRGLIADADTEQREADRDVARQGIESRMAVTARDVFEAQARSNLLQQEQAGRVQAQLMLQREELSQGELMRMQRLRQAKTALAARGPREMGGDGTLTGQEVADMMLQVETGLNPLEQRAAAARVRQAEQHANLYQQQAEMEAQVRLKNAQLDAATLQQRTVSIPTPDGGTATLFQTGYDANGRPTYTQAKPDANPRQQAAQAEMQAMQDYTKLRTDVMKQAMAIAGDIAKAHAEKAKESGGAAPQTDPEIVGHWTNRLLDEAGIGRTWDDHKAKLGMGGPAQGTGGQTKTGGANPNSADPTEWQAPFSRYDPKSQTPAQRHFLNNTARRLAEIQNRPDMTQEEKAPLLQKLDQMVRLLEKGGLSPEEKAEVNKLLDTEVPPPRTAPVGGATVASASQMRRVR